MLAENVGAMRTFVNSGWGNSCSGNILFLFDTKSLRCVGGMGENASRCGAAM